MRASFVVLGLPLYRLQVVDCEELSVLMSDLLLYEHLVDHATTGGVAPLIQLSEHRRGARMAAYADGLELLIQHLRRPGARLQQQPMFEWAGMESPCFRFELQRALHLAHDKTMAGADEHFASAAYGEASKAFVSCAETALRMLGNLQLWTAISPEIRRAPPFHLEYLLSLVAKAKCRAHHALFTKGYADESSGVETWKHGHVKEDMRTVLQHGEAAARYCTTAALLWPREAANGHVTTAPGEFETKMMQAYHRAASYCAPNFQERLDHAAASADVFQDCKEVLELNDRLYYLAAREAAPPALIPLKRLLVPN